MQTFDTAPNAPINTFGDMQGKRFDRPLRTHDGKWADSTGAFLVGELERLDPMMHEPLVAVSWGRDIDLREDITMGDEATSFTKSSYASAGGLGTGNSIGNGKAWVGRNSTQITGIDVDIAKTPHPLRPWAMEIKFTIFELESAAQTGRPIDAQKLDGLQLKHEMDTDEQVYYGDTGTGDTGMINNAAVTTTNFPAGAASSTHWASKTPDEILADFNLAITTVWAASGWAVPPTNALIPPAQYGLLATQKVSTAGNLSTLKYILENNLVTTSGKTFTLYPLKWAIGAGVGGTIGTVGVDRMIVYSKEKRYIRFPKTLLARTPIQYDAIYHKCSYYGRLGVVEVVYEETVGYFDGM